MHPNHWKHNSEYPKFLPKDHPSHPNPDRLPVTYALWVRAVRTVPHVGLHVQQLQGCDPGLPSQVLQDLEPRPAVLVELRTDVQQGLPGSSEFLPGNALVQLLSGQALPLLQQVEVFPGKLLRLAGGLERCVCGNSERRASHGRKG